MNTFGYILVLGTVAAFIVLLAAWLIAENRWSKQIRITLGLLVMLCAIPVTSLFAVAITQLDDQSYFAASVRMILDESIAALEAGETGFLPRLKLFRENQSLRYESRGNLFENAEKFREEGESLRKPKVVEQAGPGYPPQGVGSPDP